MSLYTQCKLIRKTDKGNQEDVVYIPIEHAKRNKELKIKKDEVWDEGWIVSEVYSSSTLTEEQAKKASNEHRKYGTQEIAGRTSRKDLD